MDAVSGVPTLLIEFSEANGFNAPAVRLSFPTRAYAAPKLIVSDTGIKDSNGNGRAEPGELVELTVRVKNAGAGQAKVVSLALERSDPDFFIQGETRRPLGEIPSGGHKDAVFTVFSNTRFSLDKMAFRAVLTEKTGKFGGAFPVEIPVNRPAASITEIVVESKKTGRSETEPAALTVDVDQNIPTAVGANPDALAVIFGIESYRKTSSVTYARRDAAVFKDYAVKVLGVPEDKGRLFFQTDDVTLGEFKKAFTKGGWLSRRVRPESDVVIYFAGHGAPDPGTGGAFLIPQDGDPNYAAETGYPLDELLSFAGSLPARSVTVFLDSCFSGADRESKMLLAQARPLVVTAKVDLEHGRKNLTVFSAAKGNQISSGYPEKRHGLFSYFLMKGLSGAADADGDKSLTSGELRDFLRLNVENTAGSLDREQTPQFSGDPERVLVRYRP